MNEEIENLQYAYNGICGVLSSLTKAGWADSIVFREVESVRVRLAMVAFPPRA